MKYKIADFVFDISENHFKAFKIHATDYRFCQDAYDLIINVGDSDLHFEKEMAEVQYQRLNGLLHSSSIQRKIAQLSPLYNAFLLHSACFDVGGAGVAFAARSGTGKSTHLANWYAYLNGTADMPESLKRLLKDENLNIEKDGSLPELTIVNGDKPIVRFFDSDVCGPSGRPIPEGTIKGVPYAYGTPWCGKEGLGCNMRTPLKHICFIERSDTNFVTKIDKAQAVDRIMKQVYMPKDPVALSKTLELVNRLINSCELWIIHCNMEPESAEVAYKAIFG